MENKQKPSFRGSKLLKQVVMMDRIAKLGKPGTANSQNPNKTCKCRGKCTAACLRKQAEEAVPPKELSPEAKEFLYECEKWKGTKNCVTEKGVKIIRHKDTVMKEVLCLQLNGFAYTYTTKVNPTVANVGDKQLPKTYQFVHPNFVAEEVKHIVPMINQRVPLNGRLLLHLNEYYGSCIGRGCNFSMIKKSLKLLHGQAVDRNNLGKKIIKQVALPGDIMKFENCQFSGIDYDERLHITEQHNTQICDQSSLNRPSTSKKILDRHEPRRYSLRAGNPTHMGVILKIQDNFNLFTIFEQSADDNYVVTLGRYKLSDKKSGEVTFFRPRDKNKDFIEL